MLPREEVEKLRKTYPVGCPVVCVHMQKSQTNPYDHVIPSGTIGNVRAVDDAGTIHVAWENGSSLGLIPGVDEFHIAGKECAARMDKRTKYLFYETLQLLRSLVTKYEGFSDWRDGDDWVFSELPFTQEELLTVYEGRSALIHVGSTIK